MIRSLKSGTEKYYYRRDIIQLFGLIVLNIMMSSLGCIGADRKTLKENRVNYLKNKYLSVIKDGYQGNPIIDGKFLNYEAGQDKGVFNIKNFIKGIKWMLSRNSNREEEHNENARVSVIKNNKLFDFKKDMIVWLGHSTFIIRLEGRTILTDPCLTKPIFVKRYVDIPCSLKDLRNIDYLIISHAHYDHLDVKTIEHITGNNLVALLPLKMGKLIKSINEKVRYQEAGWFQEYNLSDKQFRIFYLPAQHFSSRTLWDYNKILWGSFIIQSNRKTIFFAGDTAYSDHFKEISKLFPKIDICILPVGAYMPNHIMKPYHTSPQEAVQAYNDLHGKVFIPMHYGTFDLSDEPIGEPARLLKQYKEKGILKGELILLNIGEIYNITV